ncbi:MAG: hypothetical protein V4675_21955 [Verrucomicrobiota bacterium]
MRCLLIRRAQAWAGLTALICLTGWALHAVAEEKEDRQEAIRALMETSKSMEHIPFREVVFAATGHRVIPMNRKAAADQALLDHLAKAGDGLLAWLNGPENAAKNLRRINEASRLVEGRLRTLLHQGDFTCTLPSTREGKAQRSGYPDLQITHLPSGRVTYLDPKLFERTSRASSLRSFYYEPDALTGKVQHEARHLLLGISHNGKDGAWTFVGWELIDLHDFHVRLKAEFQGSNKDLYQEKLLLRKSG